MINSKDTAVSPVIGVLLMLVVTIIIAAVVSGFAGGLAGGTQKAPQLTMDVKIKNTGYAASSYIFFDVKGVSEPISTNDLKIVTSWTTRNGVTGGNITAAGLNFPNTNYNASVTTYQSPLGFGKGVNATTYQRVSSPYDSGQFFGNYTLVPGTTMKNSPQGSGTSYGYGASTPYTYTTSTSGWVDGDYDSMMAILGSNWNVTRPGDTVDIKITHIPSGKVILDKSVGVEG